eukprot:jgi/Chlat1/5954/Chrsp4S06421
METSLRIDSKTRRLRLAAKESFISDDNVALTLAGSLDTTDASWTAKASLRKKFFPKTGVTRVDVGARYDTETEEVVYGVEALKNFEISEDGLLSVAVKGGYDFSVGRKSGRPKACVELTQKIFNFTEDQDLKIKLGYDLAARYPYAEIRENNWTFNTDFRTFWGVVYDL